MDSLFNLVPEKYYDFNKKMSKKDKEVEICNRIRSDDYISSIKKDGHYNKFVKYKGEGRMESRTISTITGELGEKSKLVPHIFKTLMTLPDNTIIIGELYFHNGNSAEAGKILQCLPKKAIERQEKELGYLYYYIHDCWYFAGQNLMNFPYEERIEFVKKAFNEYLKDNQYIECAKYATNPTDIFSMLAYARGNEEEGIVMVKKTATVNPGARTAWKTLKVKKELEKEVDCFFTGNYKEPTRLYTGKDLKHWLLWEDMKTGELKSGDYFEDYSNGLSIEPVTKPYFFGYAGSIELGIMKDGKIEIFGYISGVSDDIKNGIVVEPEAYKMRPCCVTCMEFTEDNKMRHPKFVRFRDDLNVADCSWEKVFGGET